MWLPLNKQLWTPSFVLWTGGFGLLVLAAAHEAIDRRGWPALGRSMGVNAITAYAGAWLATCALEGSGAMQPLYSTLFARPLAGFEPWVPSLAFAAAFTAAWWLAMRVLDRLGWHLTI
jgi:predicted acyltransferase